MKIVTGLDALVAAYVAEKVGIDVTQNTPYIGFAVKDSDDNFVAGIIVSNWRGGDCEISGAAETASWARRGILRLVCQYVFVTMGCVRATCIVPNARRSRRTQKFLKGLGFRLEGNMRRAYDGTVGALIFGILAEDCRFLGGKHGQVLGAEAPASTGPVRGSGGTNAVEQRDGGSKRQPQPH